MEQRTTKPLLLGSSLLAASLSASSKGAREDKWRESIVSSHVEAARRKTERQFSYLIPAQRITVPIGAYGFSSIKIPANRTGKLADSTREFVSLRKRLNRTNDGFQKGVSAK